MRRSLPILCAALWWGLACAGRSAAGASGQWTSRLPFTGSTGDTIHYYLLAPGRGGGTKKLPLVLWLHGGLRSNGVGGPNVPAGAFYKAEHQAKVAAFVLRPVAVKGANWVSPRGAGTGSHRMPERPAPSMAVLLELLEQVIRRHPVDRRGIHVVGASMGGYGTWDLITRKPRLFESAIPICGGGDPGKAALIKEMKIWVFHSADDRIVPVKGSREMFRALMAARGESPAVKEDDAKVFSASPDGRLRYTEYKRGGHNAWDRAPVEPELLPWMFSEGPLQARPQGKP